MVWSTDKDNLLKEALKTHEINSANLKDFKKALGINTLTLKSLRARKVFLEEKSDKESIAPLGNAGQVEPAVTHDAGGVIREKLGKLKEFVEKPIPKSTEVEQDVLSAGAVKARVAAMKTSVAQNPSTRVIAPIRRNSVRARAAALSAKSSITNQYSNAYGNKFTPVPRRKHTVQSIVTNINEKKMPIQDSPTVGTSFDFSVTKKAFENNKSLTTVKQSTGLKMTPGRKAATNRKNVSSKSRLGSTKFIETFVVETEADASGEKDAIVVAPTEVSTNEAEVNPAPALPAPESLSAPPDEEQTSPVLPKSVAVIRSSTVNTASPLRQVAFTADFEDASESEPTSSKRKREDEDDQENAEPMHFVSELQGKRPRMSNEKSIIFSAPMKHQSWVDKYLLRFGKNLFGNTSF